MTIGQSIRYHRKRLNLTQNQLAQLLDVTPQAVSRWENDTGLPDISMAVPLARALGTTTDELLRFGDRYEEFEKRWYHTLRHCGDDPEKLLPVALDALKAFPRDPIFLFRAAVSLERMAQGQADPALSSQYIGRAMAYARLYYEMSPEDIGAKRYYDALMEKVMLDPGGTYVLKSKV